MSPTLLRQLWSLVENTQANTLLGLDDTSLVRWLLRQLEKRRDLERDETDILSDYIYSKLSLIRDLAQQR
ncbi:MAG: hypothetical protein WA865_06615 [Spirulinaceae cyanobacterium]